MDENTRKYASAQQLWRLNTCGLIRLVDWPDEELEEPLDRVAAKECLVAAAAEGLWTPKPRGERGAVQWDSATRRPAEDPLERLAVLGPETAHHPTRHFPGPARESEAVPRILSVDPAPRSSNSACVESMSPVVRVMPVWTGVGSLPGCGGASAIPVVPSGG
jgi:hypothetical protein